MKKRWIFVVLLTTALFLVGCGEKFEPTESTIFVTSKGEVKSAVMESFDEAYYDFEELTASVQKAVKAYCLDKNEESVTVESLTEEEDEVKLLMNYRTVKDYTDFNEVILFCGTYEEAEAAGYFPKELYDMEGGLAETDPKALEGLKMVVTEENVVVQAGGKIRYVSDNVSVIDKKHAKAMEAGKSHPAFILYK